MPILNWLTRDDDIGAASRVPYRPLEEVPALSVGDQDGKPSLTPLQQREARKRIDEGETQCSVARSYNVS